MPPPHARCALVDHGGVNVETPPPFRRMRLRYPGTCRLCREPVAARSWAIYFADSRQIECLECAEAEATPPPTDVTATTLDPVVDNAEQDAAPEGVPDEVVYQTPPESGIAGASARREYERRVAKREEKIRTAHPKIGGMILRLQDEPRSTRAWAVGAIGEEKLAQRLDGLHDQGVRLLHDRRIPGSRANIDHIVVRPAGVFVIDAKRYQGRPQLRVEGSILRPRTEKLLVGRRDCTKLVAGVTKQVDLVRDALTNAGYDSVAPRGVLCFVDADWPLFGGEFTISGVDVVWPKKAAERIITGTALPPDQVSTIHRDLAAAFPSA